MKWTISCLRPWLGPIANVGAQRVSLGSLARCARLQVARCPQRLNHQGHYDGRIREYLHLGGFSLHLALGDRLFEGAAGQPAQEAGSADTVRSVRGLLTGEAMVA